MKCYVRVKFWQVSGYKRGVHFQSGVCDIIYSICIRKYEILIEKYRYWICLCPYMYSHEHKRIPGWSHLCKGNEILPFIIANMKSHLMRIPKWTNTEFMVYSLYSLKTLSCLRNRVTSSMHDRVVKLLRGSLNVDFENDVCGFCSMCSHKGSIMQTKILTLPPIIMKMVPPISVFFYLGQFSASMIMGESG